MTILMTSAEIAAGLILAVLAVYILGRVGALGVIKSWSDARKKGQV